MTADPNKKTQRTFQCKDALWQKFEQMAKELECSVDYLVNDAMKQYARQRGYGAAAGSPSIPPPMAAPPPSSGPGPASSNLSLAPAATPAAPPPKIAPPPPAPGKRPVAPPPVPHASGAGAPPPLPAPASALPAPTRRAPGPPPPPMPSGGARSMPPPPPPGRAAPPAPAPSPAAGKLTISYQGETFPVTKDRFIIGRGKQSSDLTIKDPNVSRQHAMIEFSEGRYYIVDMGSTNGVEFNGQRVQRKVISEGDAFRV